MGHPLTLLGFMEMYATQDACRRALFEQRWWEGFRCARCAHAVAWYLRGREPCEGAGCGYQASLTAGAPLHKTRTELRKWLPAIWLLRRKITQAMRRGEHELLLRGVVEQTPQGGLGGAHLGLIDDAGAKTLTKAAGAQIQPGGAVKSDGGSAYRAPPGAALPSTSRAQSPRRRPPASRCPPVHIVTLQLQALGPRRLPGRQRGAPAVLPRRVLLAALAAVTHGSTSCAAS